MQGRADARLAEDEGNAPLMVAAETGHSSAVGLLLAEGADASKAANDGNPPLFVAAQNGHVEVVRELLVQGRADPNMADDLSLIHMLEAPRLRRNPYSVY